MNNDAKYQKEFKENQLLREYGTTNPKLIEEIKKKRKENRNLWIFIIGFGLIMYMIMGGITKCTGSNFDPFRGGSDYQYHHTDRIK